MNFDPRTEVRREQEEEEEAEREKTEDFLIALRCLLNNGEKKAAKRLIDLVYPDQPEGK